MLNVNGDESSAQNTIVTRMAGVNRSDQTPRTKREQGVHARKVVMVDWSNRCRNCSALGQFCNGYALYSLREYTRVCALDAQKYAHRPIYERFVKYEK